MDLVTLGMKLKDDPLTYRREYIDELRSFEALISLPTPPLKQIRPVLAFIVRNCHVEPGHSVSLLTAALTAIKDIRAKRTILGGLVLVRQKGFITSVELFKAVLAHGSDLKFYLRGCQEFLEEACYGILVEWYEKGTEKQKSFCYYFLLVLFSRQGAEDSGAPAVVDAARLEEIICEAFFSTSRISKTCMLYFLNRTEISFDISRLRQGAEYAKKIYKELVDTHMEREVKIMKLRIFVLFKKHFQLKCSITNIVLKMLDLEKEDLGDLLGCLIQSIERPEALAVYKVLSEEFVSESKDDDVVCYGMNVMREVYYRLAGLQKSGVLNLNEEYDDCISEEMDDVSMASIEDDTRSMDGASDLPDTSCSAVSTAHSSGPEGGAAATDDPFIERLKETILAYISPFRGNRTKGIRYAYKALLKGVMKNETVDRSATFILKSKTKEERVKLQKTNKEERRREVAADRRERKLKKNRKGRMKNKKNRLLMTSRKSTKRS